MNFDDITLRYNGERFQGGRMPLDMLSDLAAVRDILLTFVREQYLQKNDRKRVPSGFFDWIKISLVDVKEGSAQPVLDIEYASPTQSLPNLTSEAEALLTDAYDQFTAIIDQADSETTIHLSPKQVNNFNRLGAGLRSGEQLYFPTRQTTQNAKVICLNEERRKRLLTKVKETYSKRIQGIAILKTVDLGLSDPESGRIILQNSEYRELVISMDRNTIKSEFDGNLERYFAFDLTVEMTHDDAVRQVEQVHRLEQQNHPDIDRVYSFTNLQKGWLEGCGVPVDAKVAEAVGDFFDKVSSLPDFYAVAPTEEGGVLLEFRTDKWDAGIEFNPDGTINVFGAELNGPGELDFTYEPGQLDRLAYRLENIKKG